MVTIFLSKPTLFSRLKSLLLLMPFILFIVLQANTADQKNKTKIEIAFLEDQCTSYLDGTKIRNKYETKIKYGSRIRLAFMLTQNGWEAFDHDIKDSKELKQLVSKFSSKRNWYLLEGDTIMGSLRSKGVYEFHTYSDIGTQNIVGALPPSVLLPHTLEFSGWNDKYGCKVRKPIVLASRKPQKGRDNWIKVAPRFEINNEIVNLINTAANALYTCKDERDEQGVTLRAKINTDMLQTVDEFVSKEGDRFFAVKFRENTCALIGAAGDFASSTKYWFAQIGKTSIKFVGEGLILIDWADYDLDGDTEFLFWLNGYDVNGWDLNGYVILWNKLSKTATFSWYCRG